MRPQPSGKARLGWAAALRTLLNSYTQAELAERLFVGERSVRRWSAGCGSPRKIHQRNIRDLAEKARAEK